MDKGLVASVGPFRSRRFCAICSLVKLQGLEEFLGAWEELIKNMRAKVSLKAITCTPSELQNSVIVTIIQETIK